MSAQTSVFAPATRVMSRKLGPTWLSASPWWASVLDAGGLGSGDRVAADEALVVDGGEQALLGRADVGHHAVGSGGPEGRAHELGQCAHRGAGEADIGAVQGFAERAGGVVDG